MLKSKREDPVPYPARPPVQLLVNKENLGHRDTKPKILFVDFGRFLSRFTLVTFVSALDLAVF